jgi:tetratricopeptide (TPR) repeat protein
MTYFYQKLIVDQHPKAPEEYMRFVNVALAVESIQVATDYVDSAIVQFGERNELLANKAYILAYRKKYAEAEVLFRRIVEADSTVFGYRLGLANVLSMTDDRRKLAESLEQFRKLKVMPGSDQFNVDSLITELEDRLK